MEENLIENEKPVAFIYVYIYTCANINVFCC